jgi:hypothetical protein
LVDSFTYENWMAAGMGSYIDGSAFHDYGHDSTTYVPEYVLTAANRVNTINSGYSATNGKPIIDSEGALLSG